MNELFEIVPIPHLLFGIHVAVAFAIAVFLDHQKGELGRMSQMRYIWLIGLWPLALAWAVLKTIVRVIRATPRCIYTLDRWLRGDPVFTTREVQVEEPLGTLKLVDSDGHTMRLFRDIVLAELAADCAVFYREGNSEPIRLKDTDDGWLFMGELYSNVVFSIKGNVLRVPAKQMAVSHAE